MDATPTSREDRIKDLSRRLVEAHERYLGKMHELRARQADLLRRVVDRINNDAIAKVRDQISSIDKQS